jgi:hypothetical protein
MDKYIENWLTGLSETTKSNYLRDFDKWLAFIKMTPEEQIKKRFETTQNFEEREFFEQKFRAYKE